MKTPQIKTMQDALRITQLNIQHQIDKAHKEDADAIHKASLYTWRDIVVAALDGNKKPAPLDVPYIIGFHHETQRAFALGRDYKFLNGADGPFDPMATVQALFAGSQTFRTRSSINQFPMHWTAPDWAVELTKEAHFFSVWHL